MSLDTHVAAVQRKLTLGIFVEWFAVSAFVLAVLALLTILLQRALLVGIPRETLWVGIGLVLLVAIFFTILNRPTRQAAAVAIDQKLSLKEKFSTALHVRGIADPFAQAVVRDAEQTAEKVRLQGQFPLEFPKAGYGAIFVGVIALLAFMWVPQMDLLGKKEALAKKQEEERKIADTRQILKDALVKIESMPAAIRSNEQISIAQAELTEMLKEKTLDPERAARRAHEQLSKAEEAMKQQIERNKDFAQAQKNEAMFRSMTPPMDAKGPVSEAHRQIVKGDYNKAMDDLKDAAKQFNEMAPEEKEQAKKQMQNLAQALNKMANDPRAMQKLAEDLQKAGMNKEQAEKAAQQAQQAANGDKQAQQQLQQQLEQAMQNMNPQQKDAMQQAMQQAQQAMNAQAQANAMAQAAQQMAQAMQQMQQQGGQQGGQANQQMADAAAQMQELMDQLDAMQKDAQQMEAAQQAMLDAMAQAAGQAQGNKDGPAGQGKWEAGEADKEGNGMGGPGIGRGGQAPKGSAPFSMKQEISKSHYDEKGKHLASVFVKDRSIKGEAKLALQKAVEAAAADEGDDVDDSRVDRRSQKVMEEYFRVMAEEAAQAPQ